MNCEIISTSTPPWELLLLADDSKEAIADYIERGDCYVALEGDAIVGEYVLLPTRPLTAEVASLAVRADRQRRGIGTELLRHAIRTARAAGFHRLEISTGDIEQGPLALYRSFGFEVTEIDRDYFPKFYGGPIVEDGIECRDRVHLRMEL